MIPSDLYYTKDHEWLRIEGGSATIGITDHAQKELGDIVFVELPEVDSELSQGDEFGSVESVKAVSELFLHVDGIVEEVNPVLENRPEVVNEDPYEEGWMIKVKLTDPSQIEDLLDAEAYQAYLEEENA
jgi:glycine cleavage system H protein